MASWLPTLLPACLPGVLNVSWGTSVLRGTSTKTPTEAPYSFLHRLPKPDSLPSAGQNSPAYWRLSSWMLSGRSRLLDNLGCELVAERSRIYEMKEFHSVTVQKWRVSTPKTSCRLLLWRRGKLFQSQWRGISICFYLTSVCDCGMHFSKGCHTELRVLTLVILNPVMTNPRFQGPPDIFLMLESTKGLIFWSRELKKFSMVSLGVCSQSLETWISSNTCLHEAFTVHAGWRQRHKPQFWTSTSTELVMFGIYFEWSLIISNDVLSK